MEQNFVKHTIFTLTSVKQYCINHKYGKECTRKVTTGLCWQHYPQIREYDNLAELQVCVRKLLSLSRLARKRSAKISIVQALFEVISYNKWCMISNSDFYQLLVHKYYAYKERCELARYSYLEQPIIDSKWSTDIHYWSFPTSKRKPPNPDTCYAY